MDKTFYGIKFRKMSFSVIFPEFKHKVGKPLFSPLEPLQDKTQLSHINVFVYTRNKHRNNKRWMIPPLRMVTHLRRFEFDIVLKFFL